MIRGRNKKDHSAVWVTATEDLDSRFVFFMSSAELKPDVLMMTILSILLSVDLNLFSYQDWSKFGSMKDLDYQMT